MERRPPGADNAFEEPPSLQQDIRKTIDLAVQQAQRAHTYSSVRRSADASSGLPVEWRLDVVRPDKLHVLRSTTNGTDEWVKIGERRYHAETPTLPTDSVEWSQAEETLPVEGAVESLRRLTPKSGASYRIGGKRFLRLVYEAVSKSGSTFDKPHF